MDWIKGYLGMGRETVKGEAVSPAFYFPIRSLSHVNASPAAALPSWSQTGKMPINTIQNTQVRAEVEASLESLGMLLTGAYGIPDTTAQAGGLYQHQFFPGKTGHSETLETGQYSLAQQITGFHFTNLSFTLNPGQIMITTFDGSGMECTPLAPRIAPMSLGNAPFWSNATLLVNSVVDTSVNLLTVTVRNPWTSLAPDGALGKPAGYYLADRPDHVINATLGDVSSAWASYVQNRTEVALSFMVASTDSPSASLTLSMPRVRLNECQLPINRGHSFPMLLSNFGAASAPRGASVTLINNVASY